MSGSSGGGGVVTNIRLVKCPKCNRVLPELVDVPVYRCGGCGVVLQAKNPNTKLQGTRSVPSEAPLAHTPELGHTQDHQVQNHTHIPASRDQSTANCVAEVEGGTVPNEYSVDNVVLHSDDGNSERNNQQDSGCQLEGPSKDEVHVGTNTPSVSSSPVKETSYGLDHHCTSYFRGSDGEMQPCSRKNNLAVECQLEEEVQGSQNGATYESAGVEADELLIKRKRKPIVATGNTHLASRSLPADGVYEYDGPESINERASTFSSPVSEELQSFGAKSSSPNEDDYAYGSSYSDVIQTLPVKEAEHSPASSPSVYDSVMRANELEGTEAVVPISPERSSTYGKISKSAASRSGFAYDGSISSYEDQYDHIHKEAFIDVNYPDNAGRRNFDENQVSNIKAMQQQAQEFFSEKNHKTTLESSWNPVESDELMRRKIQNQMGFEAEIYPSGAPFSNRAYDNDRFNSDMLPYTEKKRAELLKMVHELQEELSRSPVGNGNVDRRNISQFSQQRQMPEHHRGREFMNAADIRSNYSRHPYTRSEQGTNWPRQQNNSCAPFSGELRNRRQHDEHYRQHRQHFSAQLASSVYSGCSLNSGLQRVHLHPSNQFRHPYSSSTDTNIHLRVHDMTYNDQRRMERYVEEASVANSSIATDHLRNNEMKMIHARENQQRVKRQVRPIAVGAPFITCYRCWSMLQVPADSFLFKRRFHKLKCGSCSTILRFSLQDRTHIVPYYKAPPPSEINQISNANMNGSDHGFSTSFGRSFSATEGKQEFLADSVHAAQANRASGRKTSFDLLEGNKKRFSKPFFSKDKHSVRVPEASSTSRTFNIEDYHLECSAVKTRTGSPLHRLMGYTSISEVFRGPSKGTSEPFRNKRSG